MTNGLQTYKFVPKGWGYEKWIVNNDKYCGKVLFIAKDRRFSWHYHKLKTETFLCQSGNVLCLWRNFSDYMRDGGQNRTLLSKGDIFQVNPYLLHQLIALQDSEIIEFSTTHFDEDSYRLEKGD
jgi:quercetin dioxygenase-like cupin family protein